MAVQEILNCPYQGSLRRLYLESKALELIAHNLAQLIVGKNGHNKPFTLLPGILERVRDARDVLIRNLENPSSLLELARQVGINKSLSSALLYCLNDSATFENLLVSILTHFQCYFF